jgi:hypothetical protein
MKNGERVLVSKGILDGIEWVEQSSNINMYNYLEVVQLCFRKGYDGAATWIISNKKLYEMGITNGFIAEED